ncbi:MAG: DNA polymerase IV [Candidatus Omnitrophota bacterium]
MENNRFIVHVDMDAFFASIEQRDNPVYQGKPVVVGANPKAGNGRGVVSTCSYEARKFGIHSAMPISIAYRKCPNAIFVPVNYSKYVEVSNQIVDIFNTFSPDVEQVSIDEAFIDISDTYKLHHSAHQTCVEMKKQIKKETGLTASVGLAPTKMAAKIASGLKKPDGLVEVTKDKLLNFLWPLDVDKLWGIGEKTKIALNQMGIYKIKDLAQKTKNELISVFGKNGAWFWEASHGIDESEVISEHQTKSISNETTFEKDTSDKTEIERELAWLCELVASRLRKEMFKCRTITLKIRLEGFQTYTRAKTVAEPTNFPEILIKEIKQLLENFKLNDKKVRLLGVRTSNLSNASDELLFKTNDEIKKEKVNKAVDKIKNKFGKSCILRAISVK